MSDLWTEWAFGVLGGIGAPVTGINIDTLWAWSGAESGPMRMRWNNPLNTTQPEGAGNVDANRVGVKIYPTLQQGINATIITLRNGYYPTIVNYLRGSVPRQSWQNACGELGKWGTGCGWLTRDYGAAPQGETDLTPGESAEAHDVHEAVARIERALGTALPGVAGPAPNQPNYLGWSQAVTKGISDIEAAIAKLPTGGADLTALQAAVNAIKAVTDQLAGIK